MREIKFRTWVPSYEEMIVLENTGVQNFDCENGFSAMFTADGYSEIWAHENYGIKEDAVLMQFTELKDNNDVDIYEGDIVKCHYFYEGLGESMGVVEMEKEVVGVIEIKAMGLYIQCKNEEDSAFLLYINGLHEESFEIIGNIYQNPELIP